MSIREYFKHATMGFCERVENKEKKLNPNQLEDEPDYFICIQVENNTGEEDLEYPILIPVEVFRKHPLTCLPESKLNQMKSGRLYYEYRKPDNYYCLKLYTIERGYFAITFSINELKRFYNLAADHPLSVTKKSWWRNLFD